MVSERMLQPNGSWLQDTCTVMRCQMCDAKKAGTTNSFTMCYTMHEHTSPYPSVSLAKRHQKLKVRAFIVQRQLSEAKSALQKQWRELSGSFEDQLRHLELECSTKLEQAAQQVQLMSQTAAEREAEARQAHSKERAAADKAAVSADFAGTLFSMLGS